MSHIDRESLIRYLQDQLEGHTIKLPMDLVVNIVINEINRFPGANLTHIDRIRSMSEEELATWLYNQYQKLKDHPGAAKEAIIYEWVKWLKSPIGP